MNDGMLTPSERNAVSYHDLLNELIISYDDRIPLNPIRRLEEFFTWTESIVASKNRKRVFIQFMDKKAVTIPELAEVLEIPYGSANRHVKKMCSMGILERIVKARYVKKVPGNQPAFYGLKGKWKPEDVVQAVQRYKRIKDKSFSIVRKVSQSIMNDFIAFEPEIQLTKIIEVCKTNCRGFYSFDIAQQVANNLQVNHGVKVWR